MEDAKMDLERLHCLVTVYFPGSTKRYDYFSLWHNLQPGDIVLVDSRNGVGAAIIDNGNSTNPILDHVEYAWVLAPVTSVVEESRKLIDMYKYREDC